MDVQKNNNSRLRESRPIDKTVDESFFWWKSKYTFIKKTEIKTWQAVTIVAFAAGVFAAIIWTSQFGLHMGVKADNPEATIALSTTKTTAVSGEEVPVEIRMNTDSSDIVVARIVMRYDKRLLSINNADIDLTGSLFNTGNTCIFPNDYENSDLRGKPCQMINNDAVNGIFSLTLAMPSSKAVENPGTKINASDGLVATVNFHAVTNISNTLNSMGIQFASVGNYNDSDLIVDDNVGSDVLFSVAQRSTVTYGDLNSDRIINGADLSILRANYGNNSPINVANIKSSGTVGGADLSILRSNFGKSY